MKPYDLLLSRLALALVLLCMLLIVPTIYALEYFTAYGCLFVVTYVGVPLYLIYRVVRYFRYKDKGKGWRWVCASFVALLLSVAFYGFLCYLIDRAIARTSGE